MQAYLGPAEVVIHDGPLGTRPRLVPDKRDKFFASPKNIAKEIFNVINQDRSTRSFRL